MASKDVQIVVLQRGWVIVGEFSQEGEECVVRNGYVLRRWGTTKGLGELAEGPTGETKYDKIPEARFHPLTTIYRVKVGGKWDELCSAR